MCFTDTRRKADSDAAREPPRGLPFPRIFFHVFPRVFDLQPR